MAEEAAVRFLVVVPEEKFIAQIRCCADIAQYVAQFIVSKPCESLLAQIEEAAAQTPVAGIVTRGSLARYLYSSKVKLPIFQLEYDLFNIMELLRSYTEKGYRRIALLEIGCGISEMNQTADLWKDEWNARDALCSELDIGEICYTYRKAYDTQGLRESILELKERGIDFVIGDVDPCAIANEYGIPSAVIQIDDNCYRNTIEKALLATSALAMEKSKSAFIEDITNLVPEAIVVIDESGAIMKYNQAAEKLLPAEAACGSISELFGMPKEEILRLPANHVLDIRGKRCVVNLIPVILDGGQRYAVMLNNVTDIEGMELSVRISSKGNNLVAKTRFEDMVYQDEHMAEVVEQAKKYARSSATIMICGATGTGKEVLASSIHNASTRRDGPFVAINCATFTETLIESELFGYEKGAFTGALPGGKKGLFELAHRGTIFLDEVADLPMSVQAKFLRVLQEREIRRIGGDRIIPIDVRIIVATNKSLCQMVESGSFREDLYYRLSVLELVIPSLRDRPKDIIPLFKAFLRENSDKEQRLLYWENDSVFADLLLYDWPGNIRELRNFAERVVLLADSYKLTRELIRSLMQLKHTTGPKKRTFSMPLTNDLKRLESDYISYLLQYFGNDRDKLCRYLNISKTTLWRRLGGGPSPKTPNGGPAPQ